MTADPMLRYVSRSATQPDDARQVSQALSQMRGLITQLEQVVVPERLSATAELGEALERFSVQTSLIGQVKAGKTALSNALLGVDGLLPSDVNPWTSVVTSVHLNRPAPRNKRAIFRFFTREDWDGMIETGGRVAEMAKKADLDTEVEDMREQITAMQKRTVARLGKNFEMLLGSQHAFSDYSPDLIKRYVCLGEEENAKDREGRFADLTKSAAIYMDNPHFTYPVTVADTPGVNDPFLVREAVTLDSLSRADICIIVLSAHQALSTADLALMRILINLKHEQIVLFINRVDELADPASQIPEINSHIRETLAQQNLPGTIPVVFGSAAWAEAHVSGSFDDLPDASIEALNRLVERREGSEPDAGNLAGLQDLSGMTALQTVLDRKAVDDICVPFALDVAVCASDLALQSRALLTKTSGKTPPRKPKIRIEDIEGQVTEFEAKLRERFSAIKSKALETMHFEMSGVFNSFLFTESRSLVSHIDSRKRMEDWGPNNDLLRRNLNEVYGKVTQEMVGEMAKLYRKTYSIFEQLYLGLDEGGVANFGLTSPSFAKPGAPVSLMRTMTVDFGGGWLAGWISRRLKKDAFLKKFKTAVTVQMHDTVSEIRQQNIEMYCDEALDKLVGFLRMHAEALRGHLQLESPEERAALRKKLGTADDIDMRIAQLSEHIEELQALIARLNGMQEQQRDAA